MTILHLQCSVCPAQCMCTERYSEEEYKSIVLNLHMAKMLRLKGLVHPYFTCRLKFFIWVVRQWGSSDRAKRPLGCGIGITLLGKFLFVHLCMFV